MSEYATLKPLTGKRARRKVPNERDLDQTFQRMAKALAGAGRKAIFRRAFWAKGRAVLEHRARRQVLRGRAPEDAPPGCRDRRASGNLVADRRGDAFAARRVSRRQDAGAGQSGVRAARVQAARQPGGRHSIC